MLMLIHSQEIISLCSQLAYTYSANRNASYPFSLLFTSLNGRTFARLESMSNAGYKRWARTEWWNEGYERLWMGLSQDNDRESESREGNQKNEEEGGANKEGEKAWQEGTENLRERIVYLTADAEDELTELKEDETYVIGGICDHNRYKVSTAPPVRFLGDIWHS